MRQYGGGGLGEVKGLMRHKKGVHQECDETYTCGFTEFALGSDNVVFSETEVCRQEKQKKRKSSSNRDWQSWQE